MTNQRLVIWTAIVLSAVVSIKALDNGLALTPPMGFNSWQAFACETDCATNPDTCISENLFKSIADVMVSDGYLDAGYEYVNIDDCWMADTRDANGQLQANADRFPSGIKALADYIHGKGLKFGIYSDYGNWTCGGYPGSPDQYLETDANTFAAWGVDYLKLDGCYTEAQDMPAGYTAMSNYLNKTGRPIVYSCSWPAYWTYQGLAPDYAAIAQVCNLWRNYDDVYDSWNSIRDIFTYYANNQDVLAANAGPGHWNDPDMLVGGNEPGITVSQAKVQVALWAIMASPLIISTDIRNINPDFKAIYLNPGVIALSQEVLGDQGKLVYQQDTVSIWIRNINPVHHSDKDYYSHGVAFLNNGTESVSITVPSEILGLDFTGGYKAQNLFEPTDVRMVYPLDAFPVDIEPTGIQLFEITVLKC